MKILYILEERSQKEYSCSLQDLYTRLSEDGTPGTGLDKLIVLFDLAKKHLRVLRKDMYSSSYCLSSEDTRRARIAIKTSLNRSAESLYKQAERISRYITTKKAWSKETWNKVYGEDAERNTKIAYRRKAYLDAHPAEKEEQIKRFMNAPLYSKSKPNLPEKNVIHLNTGLLYTGDGSYFVTLHKPCGKAWQKNPDFILPKNSFSLYQRATKVVEIMDFEFWHKPEEIVTLPQLYAKKVSLV